MRLFPMYDVQAENGGGQVPYPVFPTNWVPQNSWQEQPQQVEVTQSTVEETPEGSLAAGSETAQSTPTVEATSAQEQSPAQATVPTAEQPATPVTQTWEDAIKSVDKSKVLAVLGGKKEVLKALGISDFVADLNDYYDSTGNVDAYLDARAIDYAKYPDEEMFKLKIERDNKEATPEIKGYMLEEELAKYSVRSEEGQDPDPKALAVANYKKQQEANKIRAEFTSEQKKFTIPSKEVTADAATPEERNKIIESYKQSQQDEIKQFTNEFTQKTIADPRTQKILTSKVIPIHDGLNFGVSDMDSMIKMTTGEQPWWNLFTDEKGEVDLERWYDTLAFSINPKGYKEQLVNHGKTLAHKTEIENGGDASHTQVVTPASGQPSLSPIQNIERHGVVVR